MNRAPLYSLVFSIFFTACGSSGSGSGVDVGRDTGEDAGFDGNQPTLTISLTMPADASFVGGMVGISTTTPNPPADLVEILVDNTVVASLTRPPYIAEWDSSNHADGPAVIAARATASGAMMGQDSITVTVDNTAPKVVRQTPSPGATGVSLKDTIEIEFDEPIADANGVSFAVTKTGDMPVSSTTAASADGKTFTITLTEVSNETTLTATASTMADGAGNQVTFSEAWSWEVPGFLQIVGPTASITGEDIYLLDLKVDSLGRPVAMYQRGNDLWFMRYQSGTWTDIGGTPSLEDARANTFILDANDHPIIGGWKHNGSTNDAIVTRYDGALWQQVGNVLSGSSKTGSNTFETQVAVASDGTLYVLWIEPDLSGDPTDVWVARDDAGTWTTIGTALNEFSGNFTPTNNPVIAMDNANTPYIAWVERPSGTTANNVIVVQRWDGSKWELITNSLEAVTGDSFAESPVLTFNGSNDMLMAWREDDGSTKPGYIRNYNGDSFVAVADGFNAYGNRVNELNILFDRDGNLVRGWRESVTSQKDVAVVERRIGSDWIPVSKGLEAVTTPGSYQSNFRIASGAEGLYIGWSEETDTGPYNMFFARENLP